MTLTPVSRMGWRVSIIEAERQVMRLWDEAVIKLHSGSPYRVID